MVVINYGIKNSWWAGRKIKDAYGLLIDGYELSAKNY